MAPKGRTPPKTVDSDKDDSSADVDSKSSKQLKDAKRIRAVRPSRIVADPRFIRPHCALDVFVAHHKFQPSFLSTAQIEMDKSQKPAFPGAGEPQFQYPVGDEKDIWSDKKIAETEPVVSDAVHNGLVADIKSIADATNDRFVPKYQNVIDPNLYVKRLTSSDQTVLDGATVSEGRGRFGIAEATAKIQSMPYQAAKLAGNSDAPAKTMHLWYATNIRVTPTAKPLSSAAAAASSGAAASPPAPDPLNERVTCQITSPIQEFDRTAYPGLYAGVESLFAGAWPVLATEFLNWCAPVKGDGFDDQQTLWWSPFNFTAYSATGGDVDNNWDSDSLRVNESRSDISIDPSGVPGGGIARPLLRDSDSTDFLVEREKRAWINHWFKTVKGESSFGSTDETLYRAQGGGMCCVYGGPPPFQPFHGTPRSIALEPTPALIQQMKHQQQPIPQRQKPVKPVLPDPLPPVFTDYQIVVKAQKVVIAPGTSYLGLWHDEGLHERIIAVVVYYYSVPDSTDGKCSGGALQFTAKGLDFGAQWQFSGQLSGSWRSRSKVAVDIRERQLVIFSNYETVHRVLEMKNDSKKEITREFVCLFVVDPRHPLPVMPPTALLRSVLAGGNEGTATAANGGRIKQAGAPSGGSGGSGGGGGGGGVLPLVLVEIILEYSGDSFGSLASRRAIRSDAFAAQMTPRQLGTWMVYFAGNGDSTTWTTTVTNADSIKQLFVGTSSEEFNEYPERAKALKAKGAMSGAF